MDTGMKSMGTKKAVAQRSWDVIVIGAGPAGAVAAYELARRSLRVLLVDKSDFPRPKVCGCCLNGQALSLLQARGLGHVIEDHGAIPLHRAVLAAGGHRAVFSLPTGVALSRELLDMGLIAAAVESGAIFSPRTTATLGDVTSSSRKVLLRSDEVEVEAEAAVVLAADGLGGILTQTRKQRASGECERPGKNRNTSSVLRKEPGRLHAPLATRMSTEKDSRIGAAVITEHGLSFYQPGTIYMACGTGGYVGLVRLEDDRLNIAAAFDPEALKGARHAGRLATRILNEACLPPLPDLADLHWKGTPSLTRRASCMAEERLFILGDAASFVEPCTGEGITWALRAAVAVAPLAERGVRAWNPSLKAQWTKTFDREVERRQIICRLTAAALRRPRLAAWAVRLLAWLPSLSQPVLRQLNTRHGFSTGSTS
jgi:flavin-dependent dehydrogenase